MESIAIVGLACRYPDADSPAALWQGTLAQRRAFRRIPPERLPLEEYGGDASAPDATYGCEVAVLTGWEFDRVRFRVSRATHRTVDPSHWLALECADAALEDAGFAGGQRLPKLSTAVIVGNSLTGDYSRAAALRLRWPYVRRTVQAALEEAGVEPDRRGDLLAAAERRFKQPLPEINAETLAGWLSNTIAGRICNHFDFGGGGYVVDGACSSSLLAVTTACDALRARTVDAALAGGVDLSLDPVELVGFSKAQALAIGEMLVYDRRAAGFIPGEGCGFAVLMREADALAYGCRVYAYIRGWGVASDGHGGITRPKVAGQRRALQRAYCMAGYGIDTVGYFEGHGTGTPVGDAAEIAALTEERRCAGASTPASLGSIKANIGHTKAAAGIAGLIKATLALHTRIVPPTTGCPSPATVLGSEGCTLRIERTGRLWPATAPLRASVSAMGFGGINTHVALECAAGDRRSCLSLDELTCLRGVQDAEVFPLWGGDADSLLSAVLQLRRTSRRLSRAELTDAAVALQSRAVTGVARGAVVASTPLELDSACEVLQTWLEEGRVAAAAPTAGAFLGVGRSSPRIVLLFPGQASPSHAGGGLWRRRFPQVDGLYEGINDAGDDGQINTRHAQPAIVRASVVAMRVLDRLGIRADAAIGHSLGELCALHWGGAFDAATLFRLVEARSAAMATHGAENGGMLSVEVGADRLAPYLDDDSVVVAAFNGTRQTIASGPLPSLQLLSSRLISDGIAVRLLPVSHAFHSPGMAAAAAAFSCGLAGERVQAPSGRVISTITGRAWTRDDDPRGLLIRQLTSPVMFVQALAQVEAEADLCIEAGPGAVLGGLAAASLGIPVLSLDAGSESVRGLLAASGAAFTAGVDVRWIELARGRFAKPFDFSSGPKVLVSPCEANRAGDLEPPDVVPRHGTSSAALTPHARESPHELARQLVASRAELPVDAVLPRHRLLSDVHLNSITASQVVVDISRALGTAVPRHPIEYADASIEAIVSALLAAGEAAAQDQPVQPAGVAAWVRTFQMRWFDEARSAAGSRRDRIAAAVTIVGPDEDQLVQALRRAARLGQLSGTLVCLPETVGTADVAALLETARAQLDADGPFTVVQRGVGGGAFARSLWLEKPERDVLVANLHGDTDLSVPMLVEELREARGFVDVRLGDRRRQASYAVPVDWPDAGNNGLDHRDVLLVTGGGKGIAAESALALSIRFGMRLGLLGRSSPSCDSQLAANLERFAARGVSARYVPCDVADPEAVRGAVDAIESQLGPVTAVLHGAGINDPALLQNITDDAIARTLAIKIDGLTNVLSAINTSRLRLCIGFGSLTARTGFRGESHYAAANELMVSSLQSWGVRHPDCRCLGIEWSVWAGTGMGDRLGRLASLEREGITPLTIDQGTSLLCRLVAAPEARGTVIATGRFPQGPTLRMAGSDPPAWRFLERPVAWFPGVELVADADVSRSSDPSLDDHVVDGQRVLPGVLGLEAMAQAAAALFQPDPALDIEFTDVAFARPILTATSGTRRIRVAALLDGDHVDAVIRSDESTFAADHLRARVRFVPADWRTNSERAVRPLNAGVTVDAVPLYDHVFFQRGRFQRVASYSELHATACTARLAPSTGGRWFSTFLSDTLVLGNPGARDALMHAIQPCVPELTLLPAAVQRVTIGQGAVSHVVSASERSHDGRAFVYDASAFDADGRECERWEGLCLCALGAFRPRAEWVPPLVGPAVERALARIAGGEAVRAVVARSASQRKESGRAIVSSLLGRSIDRRPDGQPQFADDTSDCISIAHEGDTILAVAGSRGALACDLQACDPRSVDDWSALLGSARLQLARLVSSEAGEPLNTAATRVWCAIECLKKAGAALDAWLEFRQLAEGWVILSTRGAQIVTREFTIVPDQRTLIAAVLCGPGQLVTSELGCTARAGAGTEAHA